MLLPVYRDRLSGVEFAFVRVPSLTLALRVLPSYPLLLRVEPYSPVRERSVLYSVERVVEEFLPEDSSSCLEEELLTDCMDRERVDIPDTSLRERVIVEYTPDEEERDWLPLRYP